MRVVVTFSVEYLEFFLGSATQVVIEFFNAYSDSWVVVFLPYPILLLSLLCDLIVSLKTNYIAGVWFCMVVLVVFVLAIYSAYRLVLKSSKSSLR